MTVDRVLGGRYRLEQVVGTGGMGRVWRGRDLRLDRLVAIKVLNGDALSDPDATERFDREARTVAGLTHPNIVTVYDFGTEGDHSYLVMELIDGPSVAALLARGPLAIAQVLAIGAQACDGLAAAHAAGVIHRDVKPGNLLLTATGVVKICDFGIARLQHAANQSNLTGSAVAMGSTSYMAPEQVINEPVDARTDLYGLGCSLVAMLTGKPPFTGDNPLNVVHRHLTEEPPAVAAQRPDVPAALATLVAELLAKDPRDRPADAAEVKARLAAQFAELAGDDGPTSDLRLAAVPTPVAVAAHAPQPIPAAAADPAPRRPTGRRWRVAAVGAAVLLAVVSVPLLSAAGCLPMTARVPPPPAAQAPSAFGPAASASGSMSPSPAANRTAATRPRSAPQPSRSSFTTAPRRSPSPPADPIVGLRRSIQTQVTAGHLTPATAAELYKKTDEIAQRTIDGKADDVTKKIEELREMLNHLREKGKLAEPGYQALNRDVNRVAAEAS